MKRVARIILVSLVGLFLLILIGFRFFDLRITPEELAKKTSFIANNHTKYKKIKYKTRLIAYVDNNVNKGDTYIFVHGAPGSAGSFLNLVLSNKYFYTHNRVILIDRPGYGYSGKGGAEVSIDHQAESIAYLLNQIQPKQKAILVGRSYGAPIVAETAYLFPELVKGLLVISGANDPDYEKMWWFNYPLRWISFLFPAPIETANQEKLAHIKQLEKIKAHWKNIQSPMIVFHGTTDQIVPVENAYFLQKIYKDNPKVEFFIKKGLGHLATFNNYDLVFDYISRLKQLIKNTDKKQVIPK